ncbi:conjugal transfer protein TraB [Agrobacterium salinitolerans]|uniref:conjugal transfer protein TraB n=1 Tax=Agrobacterium salinitolerans TaxID=1183413 RepID=UPI0015726EFE|nr:conjugal transfer protein TraB [Agrobacterium salinitolerans]NTA40331.1 conjugal transfer protein TraB [Agrobacterium salinitolerans]
MHPDLRTCVLIVSAIGAGWFAWSGFVLALPLSLAFSVVWSMANSRKVAALVSGGYFLAASRGLPQGVATFYGSDMLPGILLWVIASSAFVFVHTLLWTAVDGLQRAFRYLAVCILMAVPPFGILGWAHPITAAGVLFPGWSWLGLVALATGLAVLVSRYRPLAIFALSGMWAWSAASWTPALLPPAWTGVDLKYGSSLGRDPSLQRQLALAGSALERFSAGGRVTVFPESALGFWTPTTERVWQRALKGSDKIVIAGSAVVIDGGYDNVLVAITEAGGKVIYRERMPVPGAMWQPWRSLLGRSGGARAHFFGNPVVDIGGTRVAPLICYEQLLVWPILHSIAHDPDIIVAVVNGWWTEGTSIVPIQNASAVAWARLFDKPLVTSFNR